MAIAQYQMDVVPLGSTIIRSTILVFLEALAMNVFKSLLSRFLEVFVI